MSYREENNQVILTMSRDDYDRVLMLLGVATGAVPRVGLFTVPKILELLNRLNEGNPHYTPYQVEAKK